MTQVDLTKQVFNDYEEFGNTIDKLRNGQLGDYSLGYILIVALSCLARIRHAFAVLANDAIASDLRIAFTANKIYWQELFKEKGEQFFIAIREELTERVRCLEAQLSKIKTMSQECGITINAELIADDLRNEAHDFNLRFRELAWVLEQLEIQKAECSDFKYAFIQLKERYRCSYGYFHILADMYPQIRAREYYAEHWWLNIPHKDDLHPDGELVIAFARGELERDLHNQIAGHVLFCNTCSEVVYSIHEADTMPAISQADAEKILARLK